VCLIKVVNIITNKTVEVRDTAIRGEFRDGSMARADSENECQERCNNDAYCSAFSYCVCPDKRHNCELFASNSIGLFILAKQYKVQKPKIHVS
jgi:hypothetical protein